MITVEEYKTWAGITDDSQDAKIAEGIAMMERLVQHYCDRMFDYNAFAADDVDYPAGVLIPLTHYPVQAIAEVLVDDTVIEDYQVRRAQGQIESDRFAGANHVKISYAGGYPSTPEDLRMVLFNLVEAYLQTGGDISGGAQSVTIFDFAKVDYGSSSDGPPDLLRPWERVLNMYRRGAV